MKKLKVVTVVGTRPEIIRLSCILPELDKFFEHSLIHTGQNFSKSLKIFEHKENLGLAKSIIYGIDKVSAQNESFIV